MNHRTSYLPTFHQPTPTQRVSYCATARAGYVRGKTPSYAPRIPSAANLVEATRLESEKNPMEAQPISLAA